MDYENRLKLFGMSHILVERDLDLVEKDTATDLQRSEAEERDETYYPQFDHALRVEAAKMGEHYELFYCLERSIRTLVADTLKAQHGDAWWSTCVQEQIKKNVTDNMNREIDSGMTLRSENEIDFTTFGELGEIVRNNWVNFDAGFSSQKAFTKIMTSLNMLRGPIAHCCPLSEDEILRLSLTIRDWFRLME
jgi:Swt1-like HEPN